MLATGGSILNVLNILLGRGIDLENVVLANVVASQEGLNTVLAKFPGLKVITAAIDPDLTSSK